MKAPSRAARAAFVSVLFSLVVPVAPATAAAPSAHGYWWRNQTSVHLPPPSNVPANGLWVAQDAVGQKALSAMRYKAPTGTEIRSLALRVAQSSGSGAVILACPASGVWSSAEAGVWNTRPGSACDVAFVKGVPSSDGATWSFDVRGLARTGTLDVVILSPPDLKATFSVSFEAPGASSVVTARLPASPSPSSSTPPQESPHAGRVTPVPVPAPVLSAPTLQPTPGITDIPTVSPSVEPTVPEPTDSSTDEPLAAAGPIDHHGTPAGWLFALPAAVLVLAVFGSRALMRGRTETKPSEG